MRTPSVDWSRLRALRLRSFRGWISLVVFSAGCYGSGEDHWQHYQGGGLFVAGTPSMSPDGREVVYSSPSSGHGDIYRANRDGTAPVALTRNDDFESQPSYTPDGATIVYMREHAGERHLWKMKRDGSGQVQLTRGHVLDDFEGLSPDGKQVIFNRSAITGGMGRFVKPYTIGIDGGQPIEQAEPAAEWGQISPDVNRIITTFDPDAKTHRIAIAARDGSNRRIIGTGTAPTFSRDGKRVFYLGLPYGADLRVIDVDGQHLRTIPALPGSKTAPRVSYDGTVVILGIYLGDDLIPTTFYVDAITLEARRAW